MARVRLLAGVVVVAWMLTLPFAQQGLASSARVAALQSALGSLGYYRAAVDGVRGPLTRTAVAAFQRHRGLIADGIAGPVTRRALGRRGRPGLGSRVMRRGMRGWDVAGLQFLLARRGYPPRAIDGAFGPVTGIAVRNYQAAAGLTVDELAGPATLRALRSRPSRLRGRYPTGPVRFLRPVPGPIGDRFGAPRPGRRVHQGIDFPVPFGTRVGAAGVGVTEFAGRNRAGYGNLVVIRHRLGYTTWYAHLSTITTWVGERVRGGTRIGYVGSTGYSTGPHLHFEARRFGVPFDPVPYLLAAVASRRAPRAVRCSPRRLLVNYRLEPARGCRPLRR
ncbi:MAG TPA: peptidoglycan-binding protein [Thermoleophilaceae bacterium]|nr:peptidoglycan-binding protein [Thermoleophilaceae bacterium]